MVSRTQKTYRIRNRKRTKKGKQRKRYIKQHGSTPPFPIHPEKSATSKGEILTEEMKDVKVAPSSNSSLESKENSDSPIKSTEEGKEDTVKS